MKILIWCGMVSIGGGARLLTNLITGLKQHPEVEFIQVVIAAQSGLKEKVGSIDGIQILYHTDIPSTTLSEMSAGFDIVYFFWPHGIGFEKIDKPGVCTFHDTIAFDYTQPFLSGTDIRQYWEASRTWVEGVTKLVVSSQYVKERMHVHFGDKCQNTVVIPHAISPATAFESTEMSTELKAKLPPEYIVYPANVSPHKNHYNLLIAYARFSQRSKYPLVFFGYQTELLKNEPPNWPREIFLPTLVSLIKRLQLKNDVDYYALGYINDSDVTPIIKNAKALIMPSMAEGGGSYPVEEALCLGVPVLCSDIPVMREHLSARTAEVIWFKPESPCSILQALESLTPNYENLRLSALQGMGDMRPTWKVIAGMYIEVFKSAIMEHL